MGFFNFIRKKKTPPTANILKTNAITLPNGDSIFLSLKQILFLFQRFLLKPHPLDLPTFALLCLSKQQIDTKTNLGLQSQ